MIHWLRWVLMVFVVRPLIKIVLGVNPRGIENLPTHGPAVVCANHNSHLDTMVLLTLFPLSMLRILRPVAAADYWMKTGALAWFATRVIGVIPIDRQARSRGEDALLLCHESLDRGEVLLLFPEGSRGEPEKRGDFKKGIAHLMESHPDVPTVPVFLHGLGKVLPKGEALVVPFFCDVYVGEALTFEGDRTRFMDTLAAAFEALEAMHGARPWA